MLRRCRVIETAAASCRGGQCEILEDETALMQKCSTGVDQRQHPSRQLLEVIESPYLARSRRHNRQQQKDKLNLILNRTTPHSLRLLDRIDYVEAYQIWHNKGSKTI